jgi:hypothetical protein
LTLLINNLSFLSKVSAWVHDDRSDDHHMPERGNTETKGVTYC